jgi:GTP-binding protein
MNWSKHGRKGEDLVIDLPIGSIITNLTTGTKIELLKDGEVISLLKGGHGGFGNEHFKGSTNQRPKESTPGKEGEQAQFSIELELVVDAGLIGLPNAGKSSLLNVLTNAEAKVGNYQFTTLEPNLGAFHEYVLADIPGLIEGASQGKGLGYKFLRHIRRTKILFHCISLENEDLLEVYKTIRTELENFDEELTKKKEVIILTKTDMVDEEILAKKKKKLAKLQVPILGVSILDDDSLAKLKKELSKILLKETK